MCAKICLQMPHLLVQTKVWTTQGSKEQTLTGFLPHMGLRQRGEKKNTNLQSFRFLFRLALSKKETWTMHVRLLPTTN